MDRKDGLSCYRRFLAGDKSGLEDLLALYRRALLLFVNEFTRDAALAEDVVSDVFFELYKRKKPFDETGGARFETYLFRIARNRALNAVRGRRRRREKGISGNERDTTDLEEELIRKERARAVHRALAALPEEERTALHLRYFEDMSPEQIARVTGGGVKRTYNRLARGRVLMKQILEKEVRDEDGQTDRR